MKILITNDDGIENIGIRLLASWAKKLGEVTVVAPKVEQSAKSHAIILTGEIEIKEVPFMDGVKAYSVDSTPADCVRYGVLGLKQKYDLVLSGINRGVNVGVDVVYSGTCGAIFEAARLGMRGIAFSAFFEGQAAAAKYFDEVYEYITKNNLLDETPIYNVNIPETSKGIRMTYQGSEYYSDAFVPVKDKEYMYYQDGEIIPDICPDDLDRDTVAIHQGYITVTPLMTTRTDMRVFEKYKTQD
ncbi:MAG: 5'/3'-nucleotidase SurE [Clostridiales bacterium]|jgi:5'-nucleotidase|nr:5'/3'-nucleotidase SurE [Clostridiales bacterium]